MILLNIIFGLILVSISASFDPENIAPCHYREVATIRCMGPLVDDISIIEIGKKMANAEFRLLEIDNSSVTTIPNNTFVHSIIENIQIANNSRLISIESHAFNKSPVVKNLIVNHNPKLSDPKVFSVAKYLEPSETISFIGNAMTEIPFNAFRSQNPEKNTLKNILLSHNFISKIGQYAFQDLPHLQKISLDHNSIISLSDYAFSFAATQTGHIDLNLNKNLLMSKSFTIHTLGANVSIALDLENNLFTDLPEVLFKKFLDNKKNTLNVYNNDFSCDCSMKWIIDNKIQNINGVFCPKKQLNIFSLTEKDFVCNETLF